MAEPPSNRLIFVSYSHKDEPLEFSQYEVKWLSYVMRFLRPALSSHTITPWSDENILGSQDWSARIAHALHQCDGFVLLVSSNSLSSKYITETEVPIILERQRLGHTPEHPFLYPIVISPAAGIDNFSWLAQPMRRPTNGKALSDFEQSSVFGKRDSVMRDIAEELAALVSSAPPKSSTSRSDASFVEKRNDPLINISRLPETGYRRLVGRDEELRQLDEAFFLGSNINILSLVAWGGAGKTSLINEWLTRLQKENYRKAEAVLAWSFYDQGTKERATSADLFLEWALHALNADNLPIDAGLRGELLSNTLKGRRILIVLDGVEPLQYGPGPQEGLLKDLGLRSFLRRYAAEPPQSALGLVVLTSRLAVKDLGRESAPGGAAPVLELEKLSDRDGAQLLKDNGVIGPDHELEQAASEFAGHALALSLLAGFLVRRYNGDVLQRTLIGPLLAAESRTVDERVHGHAKRVMRSIEGEWLQTQPVLLNILRTVSLFDRPVAAELINWLRSAQPIKGVTEAIVGLGQDEWLDAVSDLRAVRLLAPADVLAPDNLDTHPLIRDWFGTSVEKSLPAGWRAAHSIIFNYLRDTVKEGEEPVLSALQPLYQAISHGCKAGRYEEAFRSIYVKRVSKMDSDNNLLGYSISNLGATSTDLAILSQLFERPFSRPVRFLSSTNQGILLSLVGNILSRLGRLKEGSQANGQFLSQLSSMRPGQFKNTNIASDAANMTINLALIGNIPEAFKAARTAITHAKLVSGTKHLLINAEIKLAWLRYWAGDLRGAEEVKSVLFDTGTPPDIVADAGNLLSEVLIFRGDWPGALEITALAIGATKALSSRGLAQLNIARAQLGMQMERPASPVGPDIELLFKTAFDTLHASDTAIAMLVWYLAHSRFLIASGEWGSAARELDAAQDICNRGDMKLMQVDVALRRANLSLCKLHGFTGIGEDREFYKTKFDEGACAGLLEQIETDLSNASQIISSVGSTLRVAELDDLRNVSQGEKDIRAISIRV